MPVPRPDLSRSNPFATRFIAPGALEFIFPEGMSLDRLVDRFHSACNRRAAIVGPHGSGKSSLLAHLVPKLGRIEVHSDPTLPANRHDKSPVPNDDSPQSPIALTQVRWFRLSQQQPSGSEILQDRPVWNRNTIIVIDGWEQLSWWRRLAIYFAIRSSDSGLLQTSHAPTRLPVLWRTDLKIETAQQIIAKLVEQNSWANLKLDASLLQQRLSAQHGSLREVLFELYDQVESMRDPADQSPAR